MHQVKFFHSARIIRVCFCPLGICVLPFKLAYLRIHTYFLHISSCTISNKNKKEKISCARLLVVVF